jgi:hypothetical protein
VRPEKGFLLLASLAACCVFSTARAQPSLHELPAGSVVEGSFMLAGKVIPLPEGKFILAHGGVREGELLPGARVRSWAGEQAEVVLYKREGPQVQVVLNARANLGNKSRWVDEPCKREDVLYRLDRAQTHDWAADCFTVNHQLGLLTNPGGIWVGVNDRMKADGVDLPLQLVVVATFARIYHSERMTAVYYINPLAFGHAADRGANWAASPWNKVRIDKDPSKAAFVNAIAQWGTQAVPLMGEAFEGKPPSGPVPPLTFPRGHAAVRR